MKPSPEGTGAKTQEGAESQLKLRRLGHASEGRCERLSGGPSFSFSPKKSNSCAEANRVLFCCSNGHKVTPNCDSVAAMKG